MNLTATHRLLCLNTAIYYHTNNLTNGDDPSEQLAWLDNQLHVAQQSGQKVSEVYL